MSQAQQCPAGSAAVGGLIVGVREAQAGELIACGKAQIGHAPENV
jgi:hypothetical protein